MTSIQYKVQARTPFFSKCDSTRTSAPAFQLRTGHRINSSGALLHSAYLPVLDREAETIYQYSLPVDTSSSSVHHKMSPAAQAQVLAVQPENDWTMSDVHERSLKEKSKEKKIMAFAEWAPNYDRDVNAEIYMGPAFTVDRALALIAEKERPAGDRVVRILDAGCGTGLCGEHLAKTAVDLLDSFHLVGVDYSNEMLILAKERKGYNELICGDLNEPLSIADESIDYCIAAGVFLEGYCGPAALVNVLHTLREGGYASISVRNQSYVAGKNEYMNAISESGCEVVADDLMPYLGEVLANYLVIRKKGGL